ncbi:MAG: stage II sporulation protein M [bacterium]|nr:stage II sporulation protein M [bacterium]
MNIETFIAERRPRWRRFEKLLGIAEESPAWELGIERVEELLALYRQTCSDLNRARSLTANAALLDELNQLAGRGYRFVYRGGARRGWRRAVRGFFAVELPAAFRRARRWVAAAAAALLLGALFGFGAVLVHPPAAEDLIPGRFLTESPRQRVTAIEEGEERVGTLEEALLFGTSLYVHNIQVAFVAFSLGALTVLGAYWILFLNGTILGAVAAVYLLDGVEVFFLAWVGPHGALEIPAIVFAGAAGLYAGHALYLPGDLSRGASLRRAWPELWRLLAGTVLTLVVAGLVEGSFSQLSAKSIPYGLKIGVAVVLGGALLGYLFGWRSGETPNSEEVP